MIVDYNYKPLSSPDYNHFTPKKESFSTPSFLEEKTSTLFENTSKGMSQKRQNKKYKATAHPTFKKSRKIIPFASNRTPSVQLDPKDKAQNLLNPELAIEHACLRPQIFYSVAFALQDLGKRSDGSLEKDLYVTTSHARKQGGQGSNGTHAAHANTAGGLADNKRELILSEIVNENRVTPLKRKVIKAVARKCTEEDLELLISTDKELVKAVFNRIWPKHYAEESLFEGSRLNDIANTTHELPGALNLQCDCSLEQTVRPYVAELFRDVMHGKITPEDATQLYVDMILNHFTIIIPRIENYISCMENYDLELSKYFPLNVVNKLNAKSLSDFKENLNTLKDFENELVPAQSWKNKLGLQTFKFNTALIENAGNYLESGLDHEAFFLWLTAFLESVKQEISKKIISLKNLLQYCTLELEGTQLPDFAKLCGKYDSEKRAHVMLSPPSREAFQMALIHTQTPPQKTKRKAKQSSPKLEVKLFS